MKKQPIKLEEAISTYLKWKNVNNKHSCKVYKAHLDRLSEFIDSKYLKDLTGDHIIDFLVYMRTKGYAEATISFTSKILRNFIRFWEGRKETDINYLEIETVRYMRKDPVVIDEAEFALISNSLNERRIFDLQKKVVIHMLWDTGMRVSELLSLDLDEIDKTLGNGIRSGKIKTGKSYHYDLVVWGKKTNELLEKYLVYREEFDIESGKVFVGIHSPNRFGEPLTPRTIQRWIKQICADVGIDKNVTPHSFRHGKAHQILNNGGTVYDVQFILRHRNLNSALSYLRLNNVKYAQRAQDFF